MFQHVFLHVGMMYLEPYRPTFTLREKADAPVGEAAADDKRVHFKFGVCVPMFSLFGTCVLKMGHILESLLSGKLRHRLWVRLLGI